MPTQTGTTDTTTLLANLHQQAQQVRRNVILQARGKGEGYVGQGLGAADMLTALYFHKMRYDANNPDWPDRDRFLLSTGHYSIILWATLTAAGLYPEEMLTTYGADESSFGMSTVANTPGVEITGGSLGMGLRLCCPFFDFVVELERNGGPLWLKLIGRDGIKPFIQAEFNF